MENPICRGPNHSSRKLFLHTSVDMCSTCLSGREGHRCHVIWTAVTAPRKPTEMSVIPRGFLFMPAFEKHTRGSSVSHSWQWKMLTDTRLCIPSGTTPPGGSHFHHQVTAFCKSEPLFKASSMESCRIMTNANKLSTICSVGCCRTAKRCKPSFLKTFLISYFPLRDAFHYYKYALLLRSSQTG